MSNQDFSNIAVEQWPIEKLVPYEQNHKKHTQATIEARAKSIEEFGVEHPIAIEEDGTIISGHGRRLSLIHLGRKFAPVRVFRGITKEQAKKLRIAANKTTETNYDTDILQRELKSILDDGLNLEGLGLSLKEEQILLGDIGEIDLGAMSNDIVGDVVEHEADVTASAKKADEAAVKLDKAFGFKTVPADAARVIKQFLGVAEKNHQGVSPLEAMVSQMQRVVDAAS